MNAPADLRGLRLELFKEPRQEQLESDIVTLLQRSYEDEFGEPARDLLLAALRLMPATVPLDRQEALIDQIVALTDGMVLRQANLDALEAIAEESYTRERVRTGLSLGLRGGAPELVFDVVDEAAVAWLGEETPFWIGEHYDTGLSETIRRVVLEVGLVDGLGVEEVGRRMEDVLGQTYGRSSSYYRLLATNGITRARNFGFVGTAQRAGMVEAEVLAVMDGRTCFRGDTPVAMADGSRRAIASINAGDMVLSCRGIPRRVTATLSVPKSAWVLVEFGDGRSIEVTPNHPVLTPGGWVRAGYLQVGDRVADEHSPLRDLWEGVSASEAPEGPDVRLGVLPTNANEGVRPLLQPVLHGGSPEKRPLLQQRLLRGAPPSRDGVPHLRVLQSNLRGQGELRGPGPVPILQPGVLHGARGASGRAGNSLRDLRDHLQAVEPEKVRSPLLRGVPEETGGADLRELQCDLPPIPERSGGGAVLQSALLPLLRGGDVDREDRSTPPPGDGAALPSSGARRSLERGLPDRGHPGHRGRRGLLALQEGGASAGPEEGSLPQSAGAWGCSTAGVSTPGGPTDRGPRRLDIWPHPRRGAAATWATVVGVRRLTKLQYAHDLQVEHDRGFIANGLVVHNSSICRALHGTVYRVSTLAAQRDAVIGSTPEEAKEIAAWRRADEVEGLDAEALAALGVAIPPYHGNCRTILVVR